MPDPETAPPTAEELRRLSIVRHLYSLGVAQSRGTEPTTAALSILPFHDAAESFLQLACERYGAGENKADFMRYWELLAAKDIEVPQRETMRRLNAARRVLKHQGILPAQVELEGFRAAVTNFLYDSTPMLFGIDFDKITLVHLISDTAAREKLEGAYGALAAHDHRNALGSAAIAFILVQRAHKRGQAALFPPHTPTSLRAKTSRSAFTDFALHDFERALGSGLGRSLRKIVEGNDRAVELLSEAIELISYGVDLKDYILFTSYIPVVHQFAGGKMQIEWLQQPTEDPDIVSRCLNFVVDAAVRLGV
jgi:hypothetical protein